MEQAPGIAGIRAGTTGVGSQRGPMNTPAKQFTGRLALSRKIGQVLHERTRRALERLDAQVAEACERQHPAFGAPPPLPWQAWTDAARYAVEFAQRSVLFWDALRQRGNNFIEHEREGLPPVLHFRHETVMDARSLPRPVNYALLRIIPPAGVQVDAMRRPCVIMDPRGGHGPGIGRFLEFERWWGGYFLLNTAEIEWITQNLFVGNRLWQDPRFDLRRIESPIILFASRGDNITPPQQAFNWVADGSARARAKSARKLTVAVGT